MKRRILSFLICLAMVMSLLPVTALAADGDSYVVAGTEGLCGSNWDGADTNNAMTSNGDVYTKVFTAVAVGEYQFKVVRNGADWIGDATGNNVSFQVVSACDVTVTYNSVTGEITVSGDGVAMVTELEVNYICAVGNGSGAWLNGSAWDPAANANKMTEISDGVYQITYSNVESSDNYQVKFAANGSWGDNWGASSYEPAEGTCEAVYNSSNNIIVKVTPELANVTLTLDLTGFDYATKTGATYTVEIAEAAAPVEGVVIDEANFPDQIFRSYVSEHFDKDGNGLLSEEEASVVYSIPEDSGPGMPLEDLVSLKGIEYFGNLKILNCDEGYLTELDVSHNLLLEQLFCNHNRLTALDVSHNENLQHLECQYNDISALDVSQNAKLMDLKTIGNPLNGLDLSQNPELWALNVGDDNLTELDISHNTKLKYLVIVDSALTHVDTTNNTALGYVILNRTRMTSFDWSMSTDTGSYVNISNNAYSITVGPDGTFDLTTLPGSFDVSRASNWVGGEVEGNILTAEPGVAEITYTYDIGKGYSGEFKLNVQWDIPLVSDINAITVSGITAPVADETASYQVGILEDGVALMQMLWVEMDEMPTSVDDIYGSNAFAESFSFKPGKVYVAAVAVGAEEGYQFAQNMTVTVNGSAATFVDIGVGDAYGYIFYVFEKLPDVHQGTPIEVASALGVTLPQIGQTASYDYRIVDGEGCVKYTDSDNDSAAWVVTDTAPATYEDVSNGQWHYASDGEALVFEEGKYYTFVAWLDADEGYYLSETAVAFVNDIPAQLYIYNAHEFDVWATFACEAPVQLITQVTLDGSQLNVGDGKTPGSIVAAETEGYTVYLEELAQESGEAVTQFEGGKSYGYGICLKAKEGYAFAEDATVTITGITWTEIETNEYISENEGSFIEDVWNSWVFIGYFDVKSVDPTNPATGDSANVMLFASLMAVSAMAVLVIGKKRFFVK